MLFTGIHPGIRVERSRDRIQLPAEFKNASQLQNPTKFLLYQSLEKGVLVAKFFSSNNTIIGSEESYPNFSKLIEASDDWRILPPKHFREYLELEENNEGHRLVTLIGRKDHIHIMGQKTWEKLEPNYRAEHEKHMKQRPELAVPPAPQ